LTEKKNIFKLGQGEYISPEALEGIYGKSKFVNQIWVHGDSLETSLVAVISVTKLTLAGIAEHLEITEKSDDDELCKNNKIKEVIVADLLEIGKSTKRPPYEFIRAIVLVPYEFSTENDFLTPSMKLKRPQLRAAFKLEIAELYKKIKQEDEERERNKESGAKTGEKVGEKAEKVSEKSNKKVEIDSKGEKKSKKIAKQEKQTPNEKSEKEKKGGNSLKKSKSIDALPGKKVQISIDTSDDDEDNDNIDDDKSSERSGGKKIKQIEKSEDRSGGDSGKRKVKRESSDEEDGYVQDNTDDEI